MGSRGVSSGRGGGQGQNNGPHMDHSLQELHHLAEVYHDHGRTEEAREIYRAIMRIRENQHRRSDSDHNKNR
jgi:hypothetical protein